MADRGLCLRFTFYVSRFTLYTRLGVEALICKPFFAFKPCFSACGRASTLFQESFVIRDP